MAGCGKRIDLYHNEYALCGKDYDGKVYLCDKCEKLHNLVEQNAKPLLYERCELKEKTMKIKLDIILEAVKLIEDFKDDNKVIIEQCNLIIKYAKDIKRQKI